MVLLTYHIHCMYMVLQRIPQYYHAPCPVTVLSMICVVVFRDLLAITAALEFNQWFIKLSIKDFKLVTVCLSDYKVLLEDDVLLHSS